MELEVAHDSIRDYGQRMGEICQEVDANVKVRREIERQDQRLTQLIQDMRTSVETLGWDKLTRNGQTNSDALAFAPVAPFKSAVSVRGTTAEQVGEKHRKPCYGFPTP